MEHDAVRSGTALESSDSIGHYQLHQCLGEGGFGQVYEAWDGELHRRVAIKRLKPTGLPEQSRDLLREARMAAGLTHPAFVKVHAIEHDAGQSLSIVMELVVGQTLRQLLASRLPSPIEAIAMIRQVAQAMHEAHAIGMTHGDLKPSNLMREPSGRIRILDFGLACHIDSVATSSMLQLDPQGTVAYMAPERLLGAPLSPLCDIYALGVILYELLTGHRPLGEMGGLALAAAQIRVPVADWPWPESISPSMKVLICEMCAKTPGQRLQSMKAILDKLDTVSANSEPIIGAAAVLARTFPIQKKWPWIIAVLGMAGLMADTSRFVPLPLSNRPEQIAPFSESRALQAGFDALRQADRPGSLNQAEKHFQAILSLNPKNAAAVAGTAIVFHFRYTSDQLDELWLNKANVAAQHALQLDDQLAIGHAAMSLVLAAEGKWELALAASQRATALEGPNFFALLGQLNALIDLKRFAEAKAVAEAAFQSFPQERKFLDYLGEIAYQQRDFKAAEHAYRRSIKLQPDAVYAYSNLAAALSWQDRHEESLKILQQGLQIRPSAHLYSNLGTTLFIRGDYLAAAKAFEHAVSPEAGNPSDYLGWANLADTLLWIPGRQEEARKAYLKARELLAPRLRREPKNITLVSRMGLYAARTGDKTTATELIRQALTLAPGNAGVHFRAGLAYELLGIRSRALEEIHKAMTLGYSRKLIESEPDLIELRRDPAYSNP